jgi:uncharacterized LabA/DUF88 family protein
MQPTSNPPAPRPRSIVYIDGFNLYYGAIKGGPNKWLDLERYFSKLRHRDDVKRIYYFTAKVDGPSRSDQDIYLRALATLPLVEVRLGRFKLKTVQCRVQACAYSGSKFFKVMEEKQTDVAIGIQMLLDAYDYNCDRFVLVSGDSDLLPAVTTIKRLFPAKELIVYIPATNALRGAATELRGIADKDRTLPQALLRHCLFPSQVPDGAGGFINKPSGW